MVTDIRACDGGANAYCGLELVVVGHGYRSPDALLAGESKLLRRLHWHHANADTALERAADSPADRLRVTYATTKGELTSIELGWVHRRPAFAVALAHTLFGRQPALAMVVEEGAGT